MAKSSAAVRTGFIETEKIVQCAFHDFCGGRYRANGWEFEAGIEALGWKRHWIHEWLCPACAKEDSNQARLR